jgi:hypothetical protein
MELEMELELELVMVMVSAFALGFLVCEEETGDRLLPFP